MFREPQNYKHLGHLLLVRIQGGVLNVQKSFIISWGGKTHKKMENTKCQVCCTKKTCLSFRKGRDHCGWDQSGEASSSSCQIQYGPGRMGRVKYQGIGKAFQVGQNGIDFCLEHRGAGR